MTFVPFENAISVQMVYSCSGQICENVWNVDLGVAPTVALMNSTALIFKNWFTGTMHAMLPTAVSLDRILVTDLSSPTAAGIEYVTGLPAIGANVTGPAPMNVTVALKLSTGERGRSARGRVYHVQLRTDQYTGSLLNGTNAADLASNYNVLRTTLVADAKFLIVASRRHLKAFRVLGHKTTVTGITCEPTIDSQRRRLPGRGR